MSTLEHEEAMDTAFIAAGGCEADFFPEPDGGGCTARTLDEVFDTPPVPENAPLPADVRWPEERPAHPPVRLSQEVVVVINGQPVTRSELYARTFYGSPSVPARRKDQE
jgi:hypothetical protein